MTRIYLDHAATTPLLPEVRLVMEPWLRESYGNPSSVYSEGRKAKDAIDAAREVLSGQLGCLFAEVLFTGSGTEAANLAILGSALAAREGRRRRILLGAAEHHCVLHTQDILQALGYAVELIPVDRSARIELDALDSMLGPDVLLVSAMQANNEFGTIQPVQAIAELAHRHGALYHCDAVQGFLTPLSCALTEEIGAWGRGFGSGQMPQPWSVDDIQADLVTISGHKIQGPKGIGAIYIRAGTQVKPLTVGGGQEREMRAGTENVAGIVGFAEAVRQLSPQQGIAAEAKHRARTVFLSKLLELVDESQIALTIPEEASALPGHLHLRFPGYSAETLLIRLDRLGVSAGSGAACSSGSLEPSHVLLAAGYSPEEAKEGLRFTFGKDTSVAEAQEAAMRVAQVLNP